MDIDIHQIIFFVCICAIAVIITHYIMMQIPSLRKWLKEYLKKKKK